MQIAEAEAPGAMSPGQVNQQLRSPPALGLELRLITLAALAHAEGEARQRDADTLQRHGIHGHLQALGWTGDIRPSASFKSSLCMLSSAEIFFRRLFCSRMVFIPAAIEPDFERQP
jgi:hypothetical protein